MNQTTNTTHDKNNNLNNSQCDDELATMSIKHTNSTKKICVILLPNNET